MRDIRMNAKVKEKRLFIASISLFKLTSTGTGRADLRDALCPSGSEVWHGFLSVPDLWSKGSRESIYNRKANAVCNRKATRSISQVLRYLAPTFFRTAGMVRNRMAKSSRRLQFRT